MEKLPVYQGSVAEIQKPHPENQIQPRAQERSLTESSLLKDKDGKVICGVESSYEDNEDGAKYIVGTSRILKSLILNGEKNGKTVSIDVLQLTGAIGDTPTVNKIFVADQKQLNHLYAVGDRIVTASPLDNPGAIAILLHELGHAAQYADDNFKQKLPQHIEPIYNTEEPAAREVVLGRLKSAVADIDEQEIGRRMDQWDFFAERIKAENEKKDSLQKKIMEKRRQLTMRYIETLQKSPSFQEFLQALKSNDIGAVFHHFKVTFESDPPAGFKFADNTLSDSERGLLLSPIGKQQILKNLEDFLRSDLRVNASNISVVNGILELRFPPLSPDTIIEYFGGVLVKIPIDNQYTRTTTDVTAVDEDEIRELDADLERINQSILDAKKLLQQYIEDQGLAETFKLPKTITERDANARAMIWLRQLKSAGVNLFAVSDGLGEEEVGCVTDLGSTPYSAHKAIRRSVDAYKANVGEIRRAKGKRMPMSGSSPLT